jgi:superfamily II DNA or RNA helicase
MEGNKIENEEKEIDFTLKCDMQGLQAEYEGQDNPCIDNYGTEDCNLFLLKKEALERTCLASPENSEDNVDFSLYPTFNDPNFSLKIAEKQEFEENGVNGELQQQVEQYADKLLKLRYEVAPQQGFIKNFLSTETPYNNALLFHGTGTGKTGSALSVAEENRKTLGGKNIIVASEIVLNNFKSQLYSESKLKEEGGVWTFESFLGSSLLEEINPSQELGISREYILERLKQISENYYTFLTYQQFYQSIIASKDIENDFANRLIIIDEVHNIRKYDNNRYVDLAVRLENLVKQVSFVRLLLLSATPIFHSVKEIVWLLNLLNAADKRALVEPGQVFDEAGNFKEGGENLLLQKATGYVSFVKGENPYTFPYRIYPKWFSPENTFVQNENGDFTYHAYPKKQIGGAEITDSFGYIQHNAVNLFLSTLQKESVQSQVYFALLESRETKNLQLPLQSLNISYPGFVSPEDGTARKGLERIMTFQDSKESGVKGAFEYKPETLEKYGRIFSASEIGKYSAKMQSILERVVKSEGIVLIYSQFLDSGLIPMALVLEESGFTRFNRPSLFTSLNQNEERKMNAKYILVTGDKRLSPNNKDDIDAICSDENKDGSLIKVILISKEGSEGVDLKNIRQVHVLEPAESYFTLEQVIGRAVRNFSHKDLPFLKRNVMIFLHGSLFDSIKEKEEAADLFFYRKSGEKAIQMGKVTRVLKQTAIDCVINHEQTNYAQEILQENIHGYINQEMSNKTILSDFPIGDEPFSAVCDFMPTCFYECVPNKKIEDVNSDTYMASDMFANSDKIIETIKQLFKSEYFYKKEELYKLLGSYARIEIFAALTRIIRQSIDLLDKYGRPGFLVNHGDYYLYQPKEVTEQNITLEERENPVPKIPSFVEIPEELTLAPNERERKGFEIFDELQRNFSLAKQSLEEDVEDVGIKDKFYVVYGRVFRSLFLREKEYFVTFCVAHNIETLDFETKLALLNLVSLHDEVDNEVMEEAKKYFMKHSILTEDGDELFLFIENGEMVLFQKNPETFQFEAIGSREELQDSYFMADVERTLNHKYASLVGCIVGEKRFDDRMMFKAVNMKSTKKSASCSLEKKSKTLDKLDSLGYKRISKEWNTDELCVTLEIALRLNNEIGKEKRTWFLTPEQAFLSGL